MGNKVRNIATGVLLALLISLSLPVNAQQRIKGGYTSGAYREINNGSYFQRVSDWFATTGKSDKEKALIKIQRRSARKINSTKKSIARKKKEIAKKQKQARKALKARKRKINRKTSN